MAERSWTDAQKNAIEAKSGTVLVSAAAGSGKTSVLVERIVRKLTAPENAVAPESLLVVTFTNAAAAEMRTRIYNSITNKMATEKDRRNEYILLLSRLGEMQICTMDSFCINLVRQNCHSLGIEADFRILSNAETEALKYSAVTKVCERRFRETPDTFDPLARMFDAGKNDSRLMKTIIKLSDFSMSEPEPEKWLDGIYLNFEPSDAAQSIWGRHIIEKINFAFDYCFALLNGAFRDISEDEELEAALYDLYAVDRQVIETAFSVFKTENWDGKIAALEKASAGFTGKDRAFPRLKKGYSDNPYKKAAKEKRDAYKTVIQKMPAMMCCTDAENQEDTEILALIARELTEAVKEYNECLLEMKKEMSAFSFSDISHFALSLLCDSTAEDNKTPLARELTDTFSEILIDEYQDTNRAQDTLFRTVSKDGMNMFFVGDVKQSIYRFRLASPEIFIEKCDSFDYYDGTYKPSKIILSENFRSRKGILDGVNFIFSTLMSRECGEIDYNHDEMLHFPESLTPEDTADVFYEVMDSDGENEAAVEARYIASKIKAQLETAYVGSGDKKRRAEPSDFCILLRSRAGILQYFSEELKMAGIPVSAESSENFFEAPEIKTVVSFLKVIDNPMKDIDLLAVMMSPLFGFDADDAAALRTNYGRKGPFYSCVLKAADNGNEKCIGLVKALDRYKKIAACTGIDALIREIYIDTSYIYLAGAMTEGDRRKQNLNRLVEIAEANCEVYPTLGGFVKFLDMMRENNGDAGDNGSATGVRVMTMHRSKGLEFPFVYVAGTSKNFNKTELRENLVISHENGVGIKRKEADKLKLYETLSFVAVKTESENNSMSEELRVYYVALTRAKQELHIVSAMEKAREKLEKAECLLSNMDKVPAYLVRYASCAAQWFLYCFITHPDGKVLRNTIPVREKPTGSVNVRFVDSLESCTAASSVTKRAATDKRIVAEISERASFKYKWADVASSLSKHTASSLASEHFDAGSFGKSVPGFMFSSALSPADIGTATHRFLQYCDFTVCREFIDSERDRLIREGRLTEKQAAAVDTDAIKDFVSSDIVKRAESSTAVFREKQFTMAKSICETDMSVPEEFSAEKTVVIGKIDLLFVENGEAVIVDYKTDNIDDIDTLSVRYRSQMALYSEAIVKSMGIPVKECILYSLKLKKSTVLYI
ncbi:MAG: helicase-exonuclease AddAB subunit AddA [Clostridia bacterium]|nr:helicase-exonuclease AddAB subunit AddA [Clostridia bacterium]